MTSHANWPSDFVDLKKVEDILQCSICYEYINTCMITPCSHNFCSLCIRKYLQFKTQCPACFEETHGSDLRKNRLVDEVITVWLKLKDLLLFDLRLAAMTKSIKTEQKSPSKLLTNGHHTSPSTTVLKNESKNLNKKETLTPKTERTNKKAVVQKLFSEKKGSPSETAAETTAIVVGDVVIPSIFQPAKSPKKSVGKRQEEMSDCPVCNVRVPVRNLNIHLDSCLTASDPPPSRLKPKLTEKRDPLPKRVYSLMKEKDLKKCLREFGLGTGGDRQAMIKRISRYVVLYNAECDKEEPRPVAEILRQVEREERDEKTTNPLFQAVRPPNLPPDKKKDPEAIEKANKEYLNLNKDNFKKLIENMRARDGRNIKPLKPLNRIDSEDSDEDGEGGGGGQDGGGPSTSGICLQQPSPVKSETQPPGAAPSVFSQETVVDDSDSEDIFAKSPVKTEPCEVHLIDWTKAEVLHSTEEPQVTLKSSEKTTADTPPPPSNSYEGGPPPVQVTTADDEDSEVYESVFDCSATPKTPRRSQLSLSARKKRPQNSSPGEQNEKIVLQSTSGKPSPGAALEEKELGAGGPSQDSDESSSEVDSSSESEEEEENDTPYSPEQLRTPAKSRREELSPEISPMRTRSVKRKSQASDEKTPQTRATTRSKRIKPSVSPATGASELS